MKPLLQMHEDAEEIFAAALAGINPEHAVRRRCQREKDQLILGERTYDLAQYENIYLLAAGKAAVPMAGAGASLLDDRLTKGVVVTKYGHTEKSDLLPDSLELIEAGHPVPDEKSREGAETLLKLACEAKEKDLILCLISGGGSALLSAPAQGLTVQEKGKAADALLSSGASIHEMNAVRKHLSAIKGGRLAKAAHPATLICLILSDVVGDDLDVIASGPTVPDGSCFSDALEIIERYNIEDRLPASVMDHLRSGEKGDPEETPKAGDGLFSKTQNQIIANNLSAVKAAQEKAQALGYRTLILTSMLQGETRQVARVHAAIAKEILKTGHPIEPPACILSGGETTVTLTGEGKGGRNQEFALAGAIDLAGLDHVVLLSAGTDGTDGPTDAAGARADGHTMDRARKLNLDPRRALKNNDAYPFFKTLDDLLITGPTHTNVMDLQILLVRKAD